jgi:hypothetical protein
MSAKVNVVGAINLITLPFNIKRWQKTLANIIPDTLGYSLKDKVSLYSKIGIFIPFYVALLFILQVIFILLFAMSSYSSVCLKHAFAKFYKLCNEQRSWMFIYCFFCFEGFCMIITIWYVVKALSNLPSIAVSVLSGLTLNVVYFFPYVVYISIVMFYSWMFWTSVEQKYVVLLRSIFDSIIGNNESNNNNDSSNNNNGNRNRYMTSNNTVNTYNINNINSGHDRGTCENNKIVSVVSRKLYNDVRERLLPYHSNLFRFAMNVMSISVFAYIILTLVRVLQANDVSPTVQLLTTFSVSVFPYVMNTVASKKGDEQRDAWKEQLKHRVKPLVDELTTDKPDLREIQLIVRHGIVEVNTDERLATLV